MVVWGSDTGKDPLDPFCSSVWRDPNNFCPRKEWWVGEKRWLQGKG